MGRAGESGGESGGEQQVIELEAKRCSLDSLGASTDEHYCGPAVTRSRHAMIHTHKCGLDRDSRAELASIFIQIFTGIPTARMKTYRCSLLTFAAALDR